MAGRASRPTEEALLYVDIVFLCHSHKNQTEGEFGATVKVVLLS